MSERKLNRKALFRQLEEVYGPLSCPVLFVRKNCSPFYFNAAALLYYPALCKNGLIPFVSGKDWPVRGLISLKGNSRSPFGRYVLSPVSPEDDTIFRVQVLNDSASERRMKELFRRDFFIEKSCASALGQMRKLSGALSRMKKGGADTSAAEKAYVSLKQTVLHIRESLTGKTPQSEEFFDPVLLLNAAEKLLSGFSVTDRREHPLLIFSDKQSFMRAVLLACRYLLMRRFCRGGVECVLSGEGTRVFVTVSRAVSSSPILIPDGILAECERSAAGGGGTVTLGLSGEKTEISLLFRGYSYAPSDFILSGEDLWQVLDSCRDLLSDRPV